MCIKNRKTEDNILTDKYTENENLIFEIIHMNENKSMAALRHYKIRQISQLGCSVQTLDTAFGTPQQPVSNSHVHSASESENTCLCAHWIHPVGIKDIMITCETNGQKRKTRTKTVNTAHKIQATSVELPF
jgi:hypothetical protein